MQNRRNGDYWRERFRKMEEAQNERSIEKAREIQEQFDRTLSELDKKINVWYQRLADNNDVSLAEAKRMLDKKELREFRWSVEEYIKYGKENDETGQWVKELENASSRVHIGWLEARKMEIRAAAEKLYGKYAGTAGEHIRNTYADNYYRTAYEIRKRAGIDANIQALDENMVEKIISNPWAVDGKNFSERIWQDKKKLINTMHQSLTRMCITGAPPDAAVSEIAKAMNASKKRAWTLVMTETAAFSNKARQECMNDLNVEEYEVVETLDDCTCSACGTMDGKHYRMDEFEIGVTAPPFHPNCRGCTAPYFNDEFTVGEKRAARNGEGNTYHVPSDMTYEEWKRAFVDGDKSGLQEMKPGDTIGSMDITHEWTKTNKVKGTVTEKQEYIVNGTTYTVDGKHVILRPTEQEKEVAAILSGKYGKTVELVPQIVFPLGIQTPDYLIDGDRFDLKSPIGRGKNLIYGLVAKKRKQSDNFIIDISGCPLSEEEIMRQIEGLYFSPRVGFLEKVVLMKNGEVLKVYERK